MDIDSGALPTDDLSQYNLDNYDDDVQTTSEFMFSFLLILLLTFFFSREFIQYQRSNILQKQ
jgi:hypothetical protein